MASADQLETMRLYEAVMWPTIEHAERHYRRTDRLFVAAYLVGVLVFSMVTATLPKGPLSGFGVGMAITFGFAGGITYQRILSRRLAFKRMRELHEQAELTLLYHHDDEP